MGKQEGENSDETDEGADHATGRLDNVDRCSSCAGRPRIMLTVEECQLPVLGANMRSSVRRTLKRNHEI